MDQRQRLILVIALSFGFMMLMQTLFASKEPAPVAAAAADGGVVAFIDGGQEPVAALMPSEPALVAQDGGSQVVAQVEPPKQLPLKQLQKSRKQMALTFTSEGGAVSGARLLGSREREQQQVSISEGYQKLFGKKLQAPEQMDMAVPVEGLGAPLSVALSGSTVMGPTQRYEVVEDQDEAVAFRATNGGLQVDKRFSWESDGFTLKLLVTLKNTSANPQSGAMTVVYPRHIEPGTEEKSSLFGGIGNEAKVHCLVGDELKTKGPSDDPPQVEKGLVHMAALDQQYFLSALYPTGESVEGSCTTTASHSLREASIELPYALGAGESKSFEFGAFMGPKDFELLKTIGHGLERTVDFGWWAVICKVLLVVLKFFHGLTANWGVAIILLTVSVKVILLPLTHKAMVSAEAMKKLQPKMEEIKKKYPDDRERQNVEVMKLYQEAKVNPLGGCLPLLLQLPIWAALFTTLRTSYDLYGEPFFGPVWTDLTYKDPTYLLPLALGVTMIITQRLQPQMMDKQQAFIFTWVMPVFFTGLMMNYPAGLSLYIFTNNLLSILQQFLLRKYLEKKGLATPRSGPGSGNPAGDKKGPGGRLKESAS